MDVQSDHQTTRFSADWQGSYAYGNSCLWLATCVWIFMYSFQFNTPEYFTYTMTASILVGRNQPVPRGKAQPSARTGVWLKRNLA